MMELLRFNPNNNKQTLKSYRVFSNKLLLHFHPAQIKHKHYYILLFYLFNAIIHYKLVYDGNVIRYKKK